MIEAPSYEFVHSGCGDVGPYVGTDAIPVWLPSDGTNTDGVLNVLNTDGSTVA